jgi:hypothetical protein
MTTDDYRRWLMIYLQLLGMQRDIAQRKIHSPGTTRAG